MAKLPKGLKVTLGNRNPDTNTVPATINVGLTREMLERWVAKQPSANVGKSFSIKSDHKHEFIDWFMGIYEEASNEEP